MSINDDVNADDIDIDGFVDFIKDKRYIKRKEVSVELIQQIINDYCEFINLETEDEEDEENEDNETDGDE
jgi:hypothetical protein